MKTITQFYYQLSAGQVVMLVLTSALILCIITLAVRSFVDWALLKKNKGAKIVKMENRMKQDIEIDRINREHKEFRDAVYSFALLASLAVIVLQLSGLLF